MTVPVAGSEQRMIGNAWRAIAVRTALVFAVALIGLDALAIGVVLYTSRADARNTLDRAFADPDILTAPPSGIWVYRLRHGVLARSPGASGSPVDPGTLNAVAAGQPAQLRRVHYGEHEYLVRTARRGSDTLQLALDLTGQEADQRRVYLALSSAAALGLVFAALVGAAIARRAIAPLGQAMARQQRFVANASHELRTPLTRLHTRAQLIEREVRPGGDPQRVAEDAAALVRSSRQLGEIVEELLLAAQLQAKAAHFDPLDLAALAQEAAQDEQVRADERGVTIELRVEPGEYLVRGVPAAIRRVFNSLLDNALAHTASRIWVEVGTQAGTGRVVATVRDNGSGLDPVHADRLFERFARGGHHDARRFGLGLALVREVMTAHGGEVTVSGAPGRGAAFTIALPAWHPEAQPQRRIRWLPGRRRR